MKNSKNKKLFTYMVVGALVIALSIICKSNEEPNNSVPELSQYAGVYVSYNKAFGSSKNQYYLIRINSDNTVDYGVSDDQSFSTVRGTFRGYFTIDRLYCLMFNVDDSLGVAGLTFSSDGNTIIYDIDIPIDGIYDSDYYHTVGKINMTKVN